MAQFGRPSSNVTSGWTISDYTRIDEAVVDDGDFIRSTTGTYECGLSAITDPSSAADHSFFFRARMNIPYLTAPTLAVSLYEGATLIKATPPYDMSLYTSFTDFSIALSAGEANSITDYSNLRLRFVIGAGVGGYSVDVSQAYFTAPDAGSGGFTTVQTNSELILKYSRDRYLIDELPTFPEHVVLSDKFGVSTSIPWWTQPHSPQDAKGGIILDGIRYARHDLISINGKLIPRRFVTQRRNSDA